MFGGKKDLGRHGVLTEGVVIESDASKAYGNQNSRYHVKVRVRFEDGSSGEFATTLHVAKAGMRDLGAVVPVRYDPADRSKLMVDEDEIAHRNEVSRAQKEQAFAAPAPTLPADPHGALLAMWEQKKELDLQGSELFRSGAPREQVGAYVAQKEAFDARFRALRLQHPEWKPPQAEPGGPVSAG